MIDFYSMLTDNLNVGCLISDGMKGMAIAGGLVVAVGSIVGLGLVALAKKK